MYLDKSKVTIKGKTYSRCLLRESFRENGKVKHRTIANLSQCSPEEIAAITLAFEHKHNLEALKRPVPLESLYATRQGPSVGAVAVLHGLACELGIAAALGDERQGKLALWQVIHVRKEESTRGHALVVMLAYRLVQELALRWMDLDLTVGEGIKQLGTLCLTEVQSAGKVLCSSVPIPRLEVAELISRSGIALPMVIKRHGAKVATKKKLQNNRVTRS